MLRRLVLVAQDLLEHRPGTGVGPKETQRLALRRLIRRVFDDLARQPVGVGVRVIAEQLQRLLRRHQRFGWVLQPLDQPFLRRAVLLAHQQAEHALAQLGVGIVHHRAQRGGEIAAARLEGDDAEAGGLERRQRGQAHFAVLLSIAQHLEHRLQRLDRLRKRPDWRPTSPRRVP